MIPVPTTRWTRWFIERRWARLIFALSTVAILLFLGVREIVQIKQEIEAGPRFNMLDEKIARRVMDSIAVGLERFHSANNCYPSLAGKYIVDPLSHYLATTELEVYIYADSVSGERIHQKGGNMRTESLSGSTAVLRFFGIGHRDSPIMYRLVKRETYLLYWVGVDEVDDNGHGDDVVH